MPPSQAPQIVRFDNFELDFRSGELRKGGLKLRLQDQPLLILQALLDSPGEVVTREQLQKKIWPADTFVDFDHGLHAAVNRLRAALSDSAESPRYIETVARRGYRFIGRLEKDEPSTPAPAPLPLTKPRPKVWNSWTGVLAGFAIALVIAAGLVWDDVYRLRDWFFGHSLHRPAFHSLAVLPLEDLTQKSQQDYFADGMTEELITQVLSSGT